MNKPSWTKKQANLTGHGEGYNSGACARVAPHRCPHAASAPVRDPPDPPARALLKTRAHVAPSPRYASAGTVLIKAKLIRGLNGLGCTIDADGLITAIDPNGLVASQGQLAVGDRIVELNKMPVSFGSVLDLLSKGSAWDVGVERDPNLHVGPEDYSIGMEKEQFRKLEALCTATPAAAAMSTQLPLPPQPQPYEREPLGLRATSASL